MLIIFLFFPFLWSSALSVLVLIFLLLSFSVQFLFREVVLPHCRFNGYNAIKYLNKYPNPVVTMSTRVGPRTVKAESEAERSDY